MWLKIGFIFSIFVTLSTVLSANYGPVFDDKREMVNVIVGRTAELPCSAKHKGQHMIIWVNPKTIVVTNGESKVVDDRRIHIHTDMDGGWNLRIEHVRYNDSGEYMCQINTSPAKIKRVLLNVQVPSHILRSESSSDLDVEEFETVKLTCKGTGVPPPLITWYKQSLSSPDTRDNLNKQGEILVLNEIKRFESGVYICKADNGVPPAAWKEMEVKVQYSPVVRVLNTRIGQTMRKETVLECTVTSYPRSKITWYKNGREINHSYRYRLELYDGKFDTWSLALQILNINESDYGDYVCEAENIMGEDQAITTLYEYREHTTRKPTQPPGITYYAYTTDPYDRYMNYEIVDQYNVPSGVNSRPMNGFMGTHVGGQGQIPDYDRSIGDSGGVWTCRSDLFIVTLCSIGLVIAL